MESSDKKPTVERRPEETTKRKIRFDAPHVAGVVRPPHFLGRPDRGGSR
jgi:hypothetical protein